MTTINMAEIYRNNLKNRSFGEEAHQNLDSERATIAERQGASENQNYDEKPTSPKTDSSGCFGIRAHFFDLDHTLVKGNSSFRFCCYLVRKRALSPLSLIYAIACYLRHLWLGGSLVWLHEKIFSRVLRGLSLPFLKQHVSHFVPEYLKKASNPSIMGYLREAMAKGEYTVILSNSPGFLVSAFAEFLGVNTWRATEYATDKEFKLECIQSVLTGEEKACALKKLSSQLSLKKEQIVAYSDSFLDLPFLLFAGKVVVVGPDRQLLRVAQEKGWTIV